MNYDTDRHIKEPLPRVSGILLHPTSLPAPYGIGDLGQSAYDFVDFLARSGQHLWQILPLTPTGFGDSPYQSFSAFAGQPLLISPDHLVQLGLLTVHDLEDCPESDPSLVDYGTVIPWKDQLLRKANERYHHTADKMLLEEYDAFVLDNQFWLQDYCLFMACKTANEGALWLDWDARYRQPSPKDKESLRKELEEEVSFHQFVQFIFYKEWYALKKYANDKHIKIIGDIPIFVSLDSADIWAHQELFQLDPKGYPTLVAGVPPDYFSETGQLWGNPLYDWDAHKAQGYRWWIDRLKHQLALLDYVRIDHFRGFEAYWAIPYGDETAVGGSWKRGPKEDLFLAITAALGSNLPIIAEDLGVITPEVESLRDRFHFPGMKVLQFAFEDTGESTFLPHQFTTANCICYTGTHDNDTTAGWYETVNEDAKSKVRQYMNTDGSSVHWDFIRTCLGTIAAYAVFPLQDVLGVGKEGRMNTPGQAAGNWSWRLKKDVLHDGIAEHLHKITRLYGRY